MTSESFLDATIFDDDNIVHMMEGYTILEESAYFKKSSLSFNVKENWIISY